MEIYKVFARFPKEERFVLTSQVRERPYLCLPTVGNKPLNPRILDPLNPLSLHLLNCR
ncbi:MAG: hypothetical protein GY849_22285 [Deltaproteobacteria bacterium]|nr:hypothetical protein [Deltaproteobacteria bacterium]